MTAAKRVLIVAGEVSGDIHGAGVVRELHKLSPGMEIFGIGGDRMQAEGMALTYHVRELSFMGFAEVLRHLPLIRSVEKTLEQLLRMKRPDVVILIDYPGFNLRFARAAKRLNIPVAYYISPQVWAWKRGRVRKMNGVVDLMLVVFPFEEEIYRSAGVAVRFVGHPLLEELESGRTREDFFRRLGISPEKKLLALIPGSRRQEIDRMLSVMIRSAKELSAEFDLVPAVACAPGIPRAVYEALMPSRDAAILVEGAAQDVMRFSEAALVASGTATLETACFGTPMVVLYRTSLLTYLIGRLLVRIKNIALANIVAGKTVVPELIQHQMTVPRIVEAARKILGDDTYRRTMSAELKLISGKLGTPGASRRVAEAVMSLA